MYPVMFETQPASDRNSRRALLDQIPSCDAYLLLLGAEYGEPAQSGVSPTEEEFEEALRSGLAILALVQEGVDRDPRQQEFVNRVPDSATVDAVIAAARACGLISQSQGVEPSVAADDSIRIKYAPGRGFEQFEVVVGADGAVIAEGPVGGSRDATASLGWMVVMHDRIPGAVSQGLRFTEAVWHAIDTRGDIDQVLLAAAVSGANGKSYSFEEPGCPTPRNEERPWSGCASSRADPTCSATRPASPPACSRARS
jgi:hypothetical protein